MSEVEWGQVRDTNDLKDLKWEGADQTATCMLRGHRLGRIRGMALLSLDAPKAGIKEGH